jgi:hypothetical protein
MTYLRLVRTEVGVARAISIHIAEGVLTINHTSVITTNDAAKAVDDSHISICFGFRADVEISKIIV